MKNTKGFTIIEVIVVIIMIAVLASIAVPTYMGYVFRARASEGIVTLGSVKTFMLERRAATGEWPDKTELLEEFNNLNDLYYFSSIATDIIVTESGDLVSIQLKATNEFGLPDDFDDPTITIHIAFEGDKGDYGWSGGIVGRYAKHLPLYSG